MRFVLQSLFWIAVVAAFQPKDASAPRDGAEDLQASAFRLCDERPEVCAVGIEAAKLAVHVSGIAVDAARAAMGEESA